MTTKREQLTKIINNMIEYGKKHNIPYFDDKVKINKFKQKYTTDHIAGLIVKYMIPAYDLDILRGYLQVEMDRLRMLAVMAGSDTKVIEFKLTKEQEDHVYDNIVQMINIIQA
jgi:hypothetical protein